MSGHVPQRVNSYGATPIYLTLNTATGAATPVEGNSVVVGVGGVASPVIVGPVTGGYIINPVSAAAQGIAVAENANVDMVSAPLAGDQNAWGTTFSLPPGGFFVLPGPLPLGVVVWANAMTSGHQITAVQW